MREGVATENGDYNAFNFLFFRRVYHIKWRFISVSRQIPSPKPIQFQNLPNSHPPNSLQQVNTAKMCKSWADCVLRASKLLFVIPPARQLGGSAPGFVCLYCRAKTFRPAQIPSSARTVIAPAGLNHLFIIMRPHSQQSATIPRANRATIVWRTSRTPARELPLRALHSMEWTCTILTGLAHRSNGPNPAKSDGHGIGAIIRFEAALSRLHWLQANMDTI